MLEGNIIAIEPQCEGEAHAQFNADFLEKYAGADCEVTFIAEPTHIMAVKSRLAFLINEIFCEKLPINYIARLTHFINLVKKVAKLRIENSTIVFLSSPGTFLFFIPVLLLFCLNIKVVHHGLSENLLDEKFAKRILFKTIYQYLSYFNRIDNIIIGMHVHESFTLCGLNPSKFKFIRMPFTPVDEKRKFKTENNPVKLITIGQQTFEKGFLQVLHIFQTFKNLDVEVSICGFLNDEVDAWLRRKEIDLDVTNKMICKSELQIGIEAADVVFFTYPTSLYRMTSSAAYFEALRYNKTIFALAGNKFFEYEAKLNKNLILCKDIDEMCTRLLQYTRDLQ